MPRTPDRRPGEADEEGTIYENLAPGNDPVTSGEVRFVNGAFRLKDSIGVFNPRSAGSGITEAQHEALDTLTHEIDETSFDEVTYVGSNPSTYIVWTDNTKVTKIREDQYTYTGSRVTQVVTIQYDALGVENMRTTEVYTYIGGKISTIDRTKVP